MEKLDFRANKYEVMRGLWKGLAVPTVMYGLEIMEVGGKEKKRVRNSTKQIS